MSANNRTKKRVLEKIERTNQQIDDLEPVFDRLVEPKRNMLAINKGDSQPVEYAECRRVIDDIVAVAWDVLAIIGATLEGVGTTKPSKPTDWRCDPFQAEVTYGTEEKSTLPILRSLQNKFGDDNAMRDLLERLLRISHDQNWSFEVGALSEPAVRFGAYETKPKTESTAIILVVNDETYIIQEPDKLGIHEADKLRGQSLSAWFSSQRVADSLRSIMSAVESLAEGILV